MSEKLEIISFKLCPFVQRAVIVLNFKNVAFDVTYIDLSNPPEWFNTVSPLGKVPVLKVGDEVLFESSVIQEYLDEITPPCLMPSDPLVKAKNRAWIAFGGEMMMFVPQMMQAKTEDAFEEAKAGLIDKLSRLEVVHSAGTYFNGDDFALIDAAYAPLLMRLEIFEKLCGVTFLDSLPKIKRWADTLLAMPCVKESVVDELPQLYAGALQKTDGYLASLAF
ncbi:glutathione S-transferase family protein [Hydrogenovibrio sp. JE_KL2]|uniref:glutathione S-transferase family protein n=1 Tax=Hydrogenovibrio sp. JE_KL2 TaxID=2651188 RepID=UPI00128B43C3|nr:glutathione S-transferase family protein [Hydrogenovibrio sp. JE_KL2]MPQ76096.1 glutathione S-transferase family protein [Hydrogenovibrio sp. JE_KL2]